MKTEIATLAGGCFWCTEAIFTRLKGVKSVKPGYSGGTTPNPSYDQVCSGSTGHSEAIQIEFDPKQISFTKILDVFWNIHNPFTLNQQGADVGTQYRSAIFYNDIKQKQLAQKSKPKGSVTEIVPFSKFYEAENYHRDYFNKHQGVPYCDLVIAPKIKHLLELYGKDLKS